MTQSEFNSAFQNMTNEQLGPAPHDPRYVTDQVLRRDRRRTRVLACLSLIFWLIGTAGMLLMVVGLNRFIMMMRLGDFGWNATHHLQSASLPDQILWGTDLIHHSIPFIECSIVSLMLAALFTVMLIFSSRQATLNRINISLIEMSNQLKRRPDTEISLDAQAQPIEWQSPRHPLAVLVVALIALIGCGLAIATVAYLFAEAPARMWQGYPRLSPFQAIEWGDSDNPRVEVAGTWYTLDSVDDIPVQRINAFAKSLGDTTWQKHFNEDLVELLTKMGHPPGVSVTLKVKIPGSTKEVVLNDVPMTEENRRAIWLAHNPSATRPTSQ